MLSHPPAFVFCVSHCCQVFGVPSTDEAVIGGCDLAGEQVGKLMTFLIFHSILVFLSISPE